MSTFQASGLFTRNRDIPDNGFFRAAAGHGSDTDRPRMGRIPLSVLGAIDRRLQIAFERYFNGARLTAINCAAIGSFATGTDFDNR